MKMPTFWTKSALIDNFWSKIIKKYYHISNEHPEICSFRKFREKVKTPKFWTTSGFFGYFWTRILKDYCHILNQHPQTCQF